MNWSTDQELRVRAYELVRESSRGFQTDLQRVEAVFQYLRNGTLPEGSAA